ncbi:hypothetical protein OPV22_009747 [Ensete ventricosum]|uniref:Uncharacterized protein n=1 Tax=Ensete ventricosum TaxID=4639 RepID=A0AAV8PSC1_ENSVE|nr:hypothetical protein OPV22_009747 [Ensete ventricosum]
MKQISRSVANETHGTTTQVAISFLYSSWATFAGDHPSLVTLRSRCSSPARSSCYGPASGPLSPVLYLSCPPRRHRTSSATPLYCCRE